MLAVALSALLAATTATDVVLPPEEPPRREARMLLELAVNEVGACCDGSVERADREAQRRWAQALYRWLVTSGTDPDWRRVAGLDRFRGQALRLDPAWAAALAVHSEDWLEANGDRLPAAVAAVPAADLEPFVETFYVEAVLEQDLQRAWDRRQERQREAERDFAQTSRDVTADQEVLRQALARRREEGKPFRLHEVFAAQRDEVKAAIDRRERKIRLLQSEFWSYQKEWSTRNREPQYGTLTFYREFAAFRSKAETYNQRIQQVSREIEELRKRLARYQVGALEEDLDQLERPPTARPVLEAR
jgi:hypothetical protein